ncbi:hypothetical protein SBRY_40936 [Actinacidiphila bryophytorum]|uniref:Uncharacterized protein n=1 Tax=Actinacidiphila bryophytorum TaxID=1436133 RepID=A0A9W4MCG9_9ACTN|nr:hypothetical protein SBRY_40936 [Actinacidiphila bryophytorum]
MRQSRVHPGLHRPLARDAAAVVRHGVLRQQDQGRGLPRPQEVGCGRRLTNGQQQGISQVAGPPATDRPLRDLLTAHPGAPTVCGTSYIRCHAPSRGMTWFGPGSSHRVRHSRPQQPVPPPRHPALPRGGGAGLPQTRDPDRGVEARSGAGGSRPRRAAPGVQDPGARGAQGAGRVGSGDHERVQGRRRPRGRPGARALRLRHAPAARTGGGRPQRRGRAGRAGRGGGAGPGRPGGGHRGPLAGQPGLPPGAVRGLRQPAAGEVARRPARPDRAAVQCRLVAPALLGAGGGRAPGDPGGRRGPGRRPGTGPDVPSYRLLRGPQLPRGRGLNAP